MADINLTGEEENSRNKDDTLAQTVPLDLGNSSEEISIGPFTPIRQSKWGRFVEWWQKFRLRRTPQVTSEAALSHLIVSRQEFDAIIPLKPDFRFAHEPLADAFTGQNRADDLRFVAREKEIVELSTRLLFSQGGAFLVTGYRGVGKTSFVNHVIHQIKNGAPELSRALGQSVEIVDVRMNFARVMQPMELMHHIIRGLYRRLEELSLLTRFDADLRQELRQAFLRTSFHITRTASKTYEGEIEMSGWKWLSLAPALRANTKRSREEELEYLGYDDKVAEYDVMRLSCLLARGYFKRSSLWKRFIRAIRRQSAPRTALKLVFIFDELDKLETARAPDSASPVDEMISLLKNIFTTSGICFIFIAGKDLQDRWRADIGRGDSVYESVFSYNRYLPALWDDVKSICDRLVEGAEEALVNRPGTQVSNTLKPRRPNLNPSKAPPGWSGKVGLDPVNVYKDFQRFLAFIGRGIPRRIVRQFNEFVYWDGQRPFLGFTREKYRRIKFFADLQLVLEQRLGELLGEIDDDPLNPSHDHYQLGVYYLIDWILARRSAPFTLAEAVAASRSLSEKIAPAEDIASEVVLNLIELLKKYNYLEELVADRDEARIKSGEPVRPRYRLRRERVVQMGKPTGVFQEEAPLFAAASPGMPAQLEQYELKEMIGQGGMAQIYRAWDTISKREVAIKILAPELSTDNRIVERFVREGQLLAALQEPGHSNIVRFYQQGRTGDGRYFIVMRYITGRTLTSLIKATGPLPVSQALAIARSAVSAYAYIHKAGAMRLDIKPANIMIDRLGEVIVIDFGVAIWSALARLTETGGVIGTLLYMSPEQAQGQKLDARSDVYSFGLVLYEMLADRLPFNREKNHSAVDILKMIDEPILPLSDVVAVPGEIEALVMKCLEKSPDQRFQSMDDLLSALLKLEITTPKLAAYIKKVEAKQAARAAIDEVGTRDATLIAIKPPRSSTPPTTVDVPSLIGTAGEVSGRIISLGQEVMIGRSPSADIVLDDPQVSRYHARLTYKKFEPGTVTASSPAQISDENVYIIEDLGSISGTFVNGQTIRYPVRLNNNDQIQIGHQGFVLHLPTHAQLESDFLNTSA